MIDEYIDSFAAHLSPLFTQQTGNSIPITADTAPICLSVSFSFLFFFFIVYPLKKKIKLLNSALVAATHFDYRVGNPPPSDLQVLTLISAASH